MRMKIGILLGVLVFVGAIAGTGCATKKFVTGEVASLDDKVEGVQTNVEENQKRIREHDDQLASIGDLIKRHDSQFKNVDGKIEEVKKLTQGKLIFKETLRNSEAKFDFDSAVLGDQAKAMLDSFVQRLVSENKGVYIEIQGHTDSTGAESYNLMLGKKRADAVMDYLYKQYNIPLHRMEVISYGSSKPVGDNASKDGRAMNRRVEILVYE
jgi:outer membrane protein OmpA-like peptidoglycan-associated protein